MARANISKSVDRAIDSLTDFHGEVELDVPKISIIGTEYDLDTGKTTVAEKETKKFIGILTAGSQNTSGNVQASESKLIVKDSDLASIDYNLGKVKTLRYNGITYSILSYKTSGFATTIYINRQ